MTTEKTVQEAQAASDTQLDRRAQLAQHLAQQPQSRRTFDRWMKVLEVAGLALIAGHLAWAIYASIYWTTPQDVVAIWFALPVSVVVLMILAGVHGAGIGAFFPIIVPNSSFPFVTGSQAVWMGAGFVALSLVVGAFWGAFAWGTWAGNWAILEPLIQIIGVVVGVVVVVAVLSDLYRRFIRAR